MRHTTFRFALNPTHAQQWAFARHAGASRYAYNECLRIVTDALEARKRDPRLKVPWSGFDLINSFNAWKKSEDAGRVFVAAPDGTIIKQVTGLCWRQEVSAQVFEEAAVDLGHALAAYGSARTGMCGNRRVGFPKRKRKGRCRDSFRLRNKRQKGGGHLIRVGEGHPRTVTLPRIGTVRVHDDTRRLRRLLRPVEQVHPESGERTLDSRAKILYATISRHGTRWYVSLNLQAPDLHPARRHPRPSGGRHGGWVGIDRGLGVFAVAATAEGVEVGRFQSPKPLARRLGRLRRHSRALSRTTKGSRNRAKAVRRLSREHARVVNLRRSFLHEVSSQLAKTHAKLVLEDLKVAGLIRNSRLARAIGDAAWTDFGRQLRYKVAWLDGELMVCDRWFPSTKTCRRCGTVKRQMRLAERTFHCDGCGLVTDRDRNAAANLAAWAQATSIAVADQSPDRQAGGRVTNAPGGTGAGRHSRDGATEPDEGGTEIPAHAEVEDTREGWRPTGALRLVGVLYP
jgi:putative transposase